MDQHAGELCALPGEVLVLCSPKTQHPSGLPSFDSSPAQMADLRAHDGTANSTHSLAGHRTNSKADTVSRITLAMPALAA